MSAPHSSIGVFSVHPLEFLRRACLPLVTTLALAGCEQANVIRATGSAGSGDSSADLGVATMSVGSIDFGDSDCGGDAPESQSLTITNDGEGPLRWKASIDNSDLFDLAGVRAGTLEPGGTASVTVTALGMPSASTAGEVHTATILVTTDDPAKPESYVPVKAKARGATLELIAPAVADFGEVPLGVPATPIPVTLRNSGNVAAKVSVGAPGNAQFAFGWAGSPDAVDVAPGETMDGLVATFTPTTTNTSSSAGILSVEGPVCGQSAAALNVEGRGLGGNAGVSPGTVDLGKVGCDTQAEPRVLTVYNSGNLVFTWTASLTDGSNYTLSQSGGAVVPGGASFITVTPKKLGMTTELGDNAFGDTLTIVTDVPGDLPHVVPIKQTATGAILNWNATALDFGTVPAFTKSAPKVIVVTNSGTQSAKVKVVGGNLFDSAEGVVAAGGGAFVAAVTYTPDDLGVQKGTFSLVTEDPICAELPAAANASGTGKGSAEAIAMGGPPRRMYKESRGGQSTCVLLSNSGGRVACFGENNFQQLGTTAGTTGPVIVKGLEGVTAIAGGGDFNCAVVGAEGEVYCWGNNRNRNNTRVGKIGSSTLDQSAEPIAVGVSDAVQIDADHNMACALRKGGTVTCWGVDRRGNLGSGSSGSQNGGVKEVPNLQNITQIAVGGGGGCALRNDGTVWCWGRYGRGCNLGNGSCDSQSSPVQVSSINDAQFVMAMTGAARSGGRRRLVLGKPPPRAAWQRLDLLHSVDANTGVGPVRREGHRRLLQRGLLADGRHDRPLLGPQRVRRGGRWLDRRAKHPGRGARNQ